MKYIQFIFLIILLFIVQILHAQKLNKVQYDELNNYVDCMNEQAGELSNAVKCLYDYYNDVERYRENEKKYYGLNSKSVCAGKDDQYYYEKATGSGKDITLRNLMKELHELYTKLNNELRELEIYNRLKDYETDNFKRHDELMKIIHQSFEEYDKKYEEMNRTLMSTYQKLQPYNEKNLYQFYESYQKSWFKNETLLLSKWSLNFDKNTFTATFPYDELIQNINETDRKFYPFGTDTKLEYPVSHYYKSFWGSIQSIQSQKRNDLDDYTIKTVNNDEHSNQSYLDYFNYLNNSAVSFYNYYVWSASEKGMYLLKQTKFVPRFIFDNTHVTTNIFSNFPEISDINEITIIPQTKPLTKEEAEALNNYIEYINKEIRTASERPRITEDFALSSNKYKEYDKERLKKYNSSSLRIYEDYRMNTSFYQKAVNDSRFLPESYIGSLNSQVTAIKTLCDKRRYLSYKINVYIDAKEFLNDDFLKVNEFIKEFEEIWNEFDNRTNQLYNDIEKIFVSYPIKNKEYSWQKSGEVLFDLCKENLTVLLNAKDHYKNGSDMTASVEPIRSLSRQILLDEYKNLEGLKKLGRYHGHCPYTPYEDIPKDSKDYSMKFNELKELEKDTVIHGNYRKLLRLYNDINEDYNKFVWLAEGDYETAITQQYESTHLLKAKYGNDIFKVIYPNPIKKEVTKVINNDDASDISTSMDGYAENNLILLLDVSQSMNKEEKLPLLKESFKKLLKILRSEDKVAVVIYSGDAQIVLESTSCSEKDKIVDVINNLESGGSTNIEDGVKAAYKTAKENFIKNGNNRIILATDGEFEVSDKLIKLVQKTSDDNIFFSVFHYGKNKGKKTSLYELSQTGKGNYAIITMENSDEMLAKEAKAIRKSMNE